MVRRGGSMFTPQSLLSSVRQLGTRALALAAAAACASGTGGSAAVAGGVIAAPPATTDSASFVTRLGVDTVAVERVVYTSQRVEADVLLRVPATTRTRYVLD